MFTVDVKQQQHNNNNVALLSGRGTIDGRLNNDLSLLLGMRSAILDILVFHLFPHFRICSILFFLPALFLLSFTVHSEVAFAKPEYVKMRSCSDVCCFFFQWLLRMSSLVTLS